MSGLTTVPGFKDAIRAAVDLDVFAADTPSEYSRGAAEVIADAFIHGDVDMDSRRCYIRREIENERLRLGL